jgi:hypothetical protein
MQVLIQQAQAQLQQQQLELDELLADCAAAAA